MQNKENIRKELNELIENKLILKYTLETDKISIILLEEKEITVLTDFQTCYKVNGNSYESFEQLLSANSEKYRDKFNCLLSEKLLALQKIQNDDE